MLDSQSIQGYWEAAGDVASRVGGAHGPIPGCFLLDSWVEIEEAMDENGMHLKKNPWDFFKLDIGKILRLDIDFWEIKRIKIPGRP